MMMQQNALPLAPDTGILMGYQQIKPLVSKEDQLFFENIHKMMPTQKKYLQAQKEGVIEDTQKLFERKPDRPLRSVILKILKNLPDFLTGENLVQVVTYIAQTWAQCELEAKKQIAVEA